MRVNNAIYGRPLGHFYALDVQSMYPKIFNDLFTFSVVRHPVDRLYSAYCFSRKGGTEEMAMQNGNQYVNNSDFISFERFVQKWLIKQNLNKVDGVFRPQHFYLFDKNDNLLVDNFYRLEEIENSYDEISKKLGRPFSLDHHNISEKDESVISSDSKQVIYKLYQKDFELLGYSKKEN